MALRCSQPRHGRPACRRRSRRCQSGYLSPPPRRHLQPLLPPPPPPCSSVLPVPMAAEAAVTPPPPPPSPTEVVAPPADPSIPSGDARPGQVFHEQFRVGSGQHGSTVPLSAPSAAPPWVPPPVVGSPTAS
ncbi:uncharacterized protein LOC126298088 [Schistocerca gregaria]|uniref:uncharacterized protein LOC126298088 n=1 Tax=Schistocerca gregaria TaxID=7010 RepID=UPI00211F0FC3|nr:uncharacterized protein LOC126298088 [Schistocerca gregaria]